MGLLSKIFGSSKNQSIKLLEASIALLGLGIFSKLSKKYVPLHGKQKGEFLSTAIINGALLETPGNKEAEIFLQNNSPLVTQETLQLKSDPDIASALSYLYAAQTLFLVFETKEILSARSLELGKKASDLSIYIPNTFDICGSDDAIQCIQAIWEYAKTFMDKNK
jgi:hypothetical protein